MAIFVYAVDILVKPRLCFISINRLLRWCYCAQRWVVISVPLTCHMHISAQSSSILSMLEINSSECVHEAVVVKFLVNGDVRRITANARPCGRFPIHWVRLWGAEPLDGHAVVWCKRFSHDRTLITFHVLVVHFSNRNLSSHSYEHSALSVPTHAQLQLHKKRISVEALNAPVTNIHNFKK